MHFGLPLAALLQDSFPGDQIVGGIVLLAGGLAGLWMARRQFARCRRLRAVTPATTGTSAEGLVRIRGRARSDAPLSSPLSATACCFYQVEIEHYGADFEINPNPYSSSSSWSRIYTESSASSFIVADGAVQTQVRPEGLELDLPPAMEHEIEGNPKDARDEALLEYLKHKSPDPVKNWLRTKVEAALITPELAARPEVQERLRARRERLDRRTQRKTKGQSFRFRQYCILPGTEYEVIGRLDPGTRVLVKGRSDGLFLISTGKSAEIDKKQLRLAWSCAGWGAALALFGMLMLIFR